MAVAPDSIASASLPDEEIREDRTEALCSERLTVWQPAPHALPLFPAFAGADSQRFSVEGRDLA